jgi:D-sedoheptulose 7-phosphate isomerase
MNALPPASSFRGYSRRLSEALTLTDWAALESLGLALRDCILSDRQVFICGNGGSAANALHIANDFVYGVTRRTAHRFKVHALPANLALLTCLANDEGYDQIYAKQLAALGNPGDLLIVLSGSGNSPNIIEVLQQARRMDIKSFAILGYNGGRALGLTDTPLHFPLDDMQLAEDMQVILGHMLMQWLRDDLARLV